MHLCCFQNLVIKIYNSRVSDCVFSAFSLTSILLMLRSLKSIDRLAKTVKEQTLKTCLNRRRYTFSYRSSFRTDFSFDFLMYNSKLQSPPETQ